MALADVQKIQLIAYTGVKMELLSSLQEEGLIQLEKADFGELDLRSPLPEISQIDQHLHRLKHALDYLSQWEEKGFVKRLFLPTGKDSLKHALNGEDGTSFFSSGGRSDST